MDAESIMEIPSDIDELEKEKAIESIVLNSSAEDYMMRMNLKKVWTLRMAIKRLKPIKETAIHWMMNIQRTL